jgi:tRNA threonylcarbamoyladenosine biosynthesis protein TsaE
MKHTITILNQEDLDRAAGEFIKEIENHKIIAFYAPMGAGKTTFTTAVCRQLGVREDAVSSPTFAIINEYKTNKGESIYHFDFYRINKISEALDIGFYDYIDSGSLCIMEWPENIEGILPEETLKVKIQVNPDESRTLSWAD